MEIYVLAGQSNMAGRGDLRDLPAQYRSATSEVMCFNAEGEWKQASEPLHRDVDLRKKDRCGVGPALVCIRAVLNLRKDSSSASPECQTVGVVPCAIGGASLDEWQKSFQGAVGDCEASNRGGERSHESRPWGYKPGSENLFGAMAARIEESMKAAPEGSRLCGVLWYQGETDAMKEDDARTYDERFQTLVTDVRALGYPDLRFFTVAITGTTARLPYLDKVRDAQLHAGSSAGMSGVWVVDAFGLPMFTDGLHLLTSAQVEVGERMALQVFAATERGSSSTEGAQVTIDGWTRDWAREDARVSNAEKFFGRIAYETKSKHASKRDTISQVDFRSYAKLLFFLEAPPAPDDTFLVLGHGVGTCVVASALLYNMRHIQGVDIMQECLDEARSLLSVYSDDSSTTTTITDGPAPSPRKLPLREDVGPARTPSSSIALLQGDVSEARWSDATLVYAACCHFDDATMLDIARRCRHLADGARVVTVSKPLPLVHPRCVEEGTVAKEEFRVTWQCQVSTLPQNMRHLPNDSPN